MGWHRASHNIFHFTGDWVEKFPEQLTTPRPFYTLPKDETPMVDMMEIPTIKLNYAHSNILQATILELPYKGIIQ